jgi:PAS domain S-box-containing protein
MTTLDDVHGDSGGVSLIATTMLDAVVAVDGEGVIVEWNPAAERIFGWTRAEALGAPMGELIVPPGGRKRHYEGMRRFQRTGEGRVINRRWEITAVDRSGREFPIELSIKPMSNGKAAFIGVMRDISERRHAQERLALSEESLRLTTEAAEIGIWDLDLETDVLTWSPRTKAMFGMSADAACSMADFYAGLHPEDREAITTEFARALDPKERATYDVEYRTVGKEDGVVRWVAAKGKGLFDEQGRCFRAVGTAIDISARKREDARRAFLLELSDLLRGGDTDEALHQACALLGRYFGVTRAGYGHLDHDAAACDFTICWTDASPPLVGRHPAADLGVNILAKLGRGETVVTPDLQSDPINEEAQARDVAASLDTRALLVAPFMRAGRLRAIVYLADRQVRHWRAEDVAFMEEVAERTRQMVERAEAEAALRALNATLEARVETRTSELRVAEEALRQAHKMEAIGQLTGGIAHDFNNLLQGVTGGLDLIRMRVSQGRFGELDRFINGAMTSANRAAALTHRLLAFARRQPLDPRPLRANPLVASMEDLLRRTLGERIQLRLVLAAGLWPTRCDSNQLESAILNLAINARDAMPDGGALTIETSNVHLDVADAGVGRDIHPGEYVCVAVTDTGVGMDPDTVARVFEPFFTTKPIGQGTGLGLSMIYGFARQSDGWVRIYSEPGEGTSVELCLPRYTGEVDDDADSGAPALTGATTAGEIVLVVEDEDVVRGLVVEVLGDLGYQAIAAADGPEGLALLQSAQRIDLLITDIGLPGLNGRELAAAGRGLRPDLKILFMTGYAENAAMASGFLERGMAMITKPFAMDALALKIREIVDAP